MARCTQLCSLASKKILASFSKSLLVPGVELPDEIAAHQLVQRLLQRPAVRDAGFFNQFLPRHARSAARERSYYLEMRGGIMKQRGVEIGKFISQLAMLGKTQCVNILGKASVSSKKTPVVRHSAKDHISLAEFVAAERDTERRRVFRAFPERERTNPYSIRQTVMKSTLVVYNVIHNPGRC